MYTYDDGSRYIGDFDENGIKNGKGHIGNIIILVQNFTTRWRKIISQLFLYFSNPRGAHLRTRNVKKYSFGYSAPPIGKFVYQTKLLFLFSIEASNGATYEGQFQKGLPNGLGVMRFPDSSRYEGEFMQGWFHGHGVFTTLDGTKFEGTV